VSLATGASSAAQTGKRERPTVSLFGLTIDQLSMDETVDRIDALIASGGVHQHVAINVDKVVKSVADEQLRAIINGCDVASVDGQPVVWASRLLGQPLPERVSGIDLMERLISRAARTGRRLAFLGAREEVVNAVVARVRREHPGAVIAVWRNGYWAPDDEAAVAAEIAAGKPDILFLAIPSPAKERFLDRWKGTIGASFVMGVGGSFDVYAGLISRAPRLFQRLGLEWLHRMIKEPRRMWRRYLVDGLRFLPLVVSEWPRSRRARSALTSRPTVRREAALRILVVTNLYPSTAHPAFGTFVANRVAALRRVGAQVEVAAIRDAGVHRGIVAKYLRLGLEAVAVGVRRLPNRRFDVVEAHIAYPTGWIALPIALVHRARLVLFVHGADVADVAPRNRLHLAAARFLFGRAGRIVVNSTYMAVQTGATLGVRPDRIVVRSPGIDVSLFRRPVDAGARNATRTGILFVGGLTEQKGIIELLDAHELLAARGVLQSLTIIGDGPLRGVLDDRRRRCGMDITVLGSKPPVEVAAAMARHAVLAVPSVRGEALGLVAIEGMAAGAIVVASRTGGLVETVADERTGFLCEPGDVTSLARALERAIGASVDPARRAAIIEAGQKIVDAHDVDEVAHRSLDDDRDLMTRGGWH
jgi:N-acetylglucosaminyldiphosphoundecaprenol N-acetyl-beta-D-mannosaminyltransferase